MYVVYLLAPTDPTKLPLYEAIYLDLSKSSEAEQTKNKITPRKMRRRGKKNMELFPFFIQPACDHK
jgi:hypothetical protein